MSPARTGRSRALQPLAALDPAANLGGHCLRQQRLRRAQPALLQRQLPGLGRRRLGGLDRRPQLDQPGMAGAERQVLDRRAVERHAVLRLGAGEDGIDRGQHRVGRAEGDVERDVAPALAQGLDARGEMLAQAQEGLGIGALEAVDRLLGIADGEDGAALGAGALAGEELVGQRLHHLPLLGVGVLRLVDQDVVEPAIELEQHPGRHPRTLQQVAGAEHEIVVIEQRARRLVPLIGGEQRAAEPHQRDRGGMERGGAPRRDHRHEAIGLLRQRRSGLGLALSELPCHQMGAAGAFLGEEGAEILVEEQHALGRGCGEPIGDAAPGLLVGDAALAQRRRRAPQRRAVELLLVAGGGEDRVLAGAVGDAKTIGERGGEAVGAAVERADEAGALQRQLADEQIEAALGDVPRHLGEGLGQRRIAAARRGQHRLARRGQRLGGAALVHHLEMRRDAGLDREAAQQRLAEGVDGLDAHAAGRVEHAGEELARTLQRVAIGHRAGERHQLLREPALGLDRPLREPVVDAVRHLGRGGLGEGEAEDARGRRPRQHQRQHAVGEHLGLAGAGRGRDPDRGRDIGRLLLSLLRIGRGHSPSSPVTDHSLTRARWT